MTSVLQTSKECSALAVGCLCAEGVSGFGKGADLSSCLEAIRSPEVKEDKNESLRKGRWRRRCMSPGTGFRVLFVEFQLGWVSMAERKRGKRVRFLTLGSQTQRRVLDLDVRIWILQQMLTLGFNFFVFV
ncbi:hypothetical protein COP2_024616 [Malus domestica]